MTAILLADVSAELERLRRVERAARAWARAHRAAWPTTTMDSRGPEAPTVPRSVELAAARALLAEVGE